MRGIYAITNILTNTVYYGQALDILRRIRTHKYELNKGVHGNLHLQRSWNKYGKEAFVFAPIQFVSIEPLAPIEKKYKDEAYSLGLTTFNIADPEDRTIVSLETRQKQSMAKLGKKGNSHSEESKRKISEGNKGKPKSEQHKQNISIAGKDKPSNFKGHKHSKEAKKKQSEAHVGVKASEETRKLLSKQRQGNKYGCGYKHTEEWKQNQSIRLKGNKYAKK